MLTEQKWISDLERFKVIKISGKIIDISVYIKLCDVIRRESHTPTHSINFLIAVL